VDDPTPVTKTPRSADVNDDADDGADACIGVSAVRGCKGEASRLAGFESRRRRTTGSTLTRRPF